MVVIRNSSLFEYNTWHSSIIEVSCAAFYGRESGNFGPASSGLWPDDNLYFLLLNHCSSTVLAKESTKTTNDARADQFCFDDEEDDDDTCTDVPNCCSRNLLLKLHHILAPSMQLAEK